MQTETNKPNWVQTLVEELKRDRRKALLLAILAVVGGAVGVRTFWKGSSPAPAGAAIPALTGTGRDLARSDPSATTDARDARWEQYLRQVDRKITRDLFAMNAEMFTLLEPVTITPVAAAGLPTATASAPDPAELQRQAIHAEAKKLELQSVIFGVKPTAIINDHVLRVGDSVEEYDFKVVQITEQSCVVQKQDVLVTLEMPKDKDKNNKDREKEKP